MARIAANKLSRRSNPEASTDAVPYIAEISSLDEEAYLKFFAQHSPRLVRKQIPRNHIPPGELEDEINDVSLMVLIKLWSKIKSSDGRLVDLYSNMSCAVSSQCIDVVRRNKRKPKSIQLPGNRDGELSQGNVLLYQNEGIRDFERLASLDRKQVISIPIWSSFLKPPITAGCVLSYHFQTQESKPSTQSAEATMFLGNISIDRSFSSTIQTITPSFILNKSDFKPSKFLYYPQP